ncbi:MAG: YcjX family GTP-binding protein [Methylovirgula sp.]
MPSFVDLVFEAQIAAQSLAETLSGRALRLGVTGLSGAGKTIFVTALVHHLTSIGARGMRGKNPLPVFRVHAEGRLTRGFLEPQPDDAVPRFAYEDHLAALTGRGGKVDEREWPQSTTRVSELRLTLQFERAASLRKGPAELSIDIVDYPGEWLLDLPLLEKSYAQWSREAFAAASAPARAAVAAPWRDYVSTIDPAGKPDEEIAQRAAALFKAYLSACRAEPISASSLPPGRFLMPGDLEGSPLLTFAPLLLAEGDVSASGTLAAMMERRYEAYKAHVVKPFFRDHFARLDRQIVLVDTLAALNAGPAALHDLETALVEVLNAFRTGRNTILAMLFRPKIDKILFAATKADHLNHVSHDRLEAVLRHLTARAIARAEGFGATVDVIALAAVRATHEVKVAAKSGPFGATSELPAVVGIPMKGERIGTEIFDGLSEAAIFPGELPKDPDAIFSGDVDIAATQEGDYRFLRFRPPIPQRDAAGSLLPLPHIRLDRALQFLLGDRLK